MAPKNGVYTASEPPPARNLNMLNMNLNIVCRRLNIVPNRLNKVFQNLNMNLNIVPRRLNIVAVGNFRYSMGNEHVAKQNLNIVPRSEH